MASKMSWKTYSAGLKASLKDFTPIERRNIIIYTIGIMFYKFGLEAFNGSIAALATNRYDYAAFIAGERSRTFERLGLLQGLNQAMQCVGSIIVAPLVKRYPTKNVLAGAIALFGMFSAILLIVDVCTGGKFIPAEYRGVGNNPTNDYSFYGKYATDGMIPIYTFCGITYGMVELIRRVIPRDIVGGNVQKLRKMDSMVHIFYEIAGTAGAFCTGLLLMPMLGTNRAFLITPICFSICSVLWFFVSSLNFKREKKKTKKNSILKNIGAAFVLFGQSVWLGGKIIFTSRKFIWLLPSYGIALYAHRYLENGILPQVAKRFMGESSWALIMVGGSNFGEMLGALFVFLFTDLIKTPIPWLRLDALILPAVWYFPYWFPPKGQVSQAWTAAATLVPIGMSWAAGDVSLTAFIQSSLAHLESDSPRVSALSAVMAFLYSFYVVTYAIAGTFLGRYLDSLGTDSFRDGLKNTAGVQFSVIAALIIGSTFIPKGSFAFNPTMLNDHDLEGKDNAEEGQIKVVKGGEEGEEGEEEEGPEEEEGDKAVDDIILGI